MFRGGGNFFRDYGGLMRYRITDSELVLGSCGGYYCMANFTNCAFLGMDVTVFQDDDPACFNMQNCSVVRGRIYAEHSSGSNWPLSYANNVFDGTELNFTDYTDPPATITYCDYNAFSAPTNSLSVLGTGNIVFTNTLTWQTGALGNFYQPTNSILLNVGSTNAAALGLYHYTTTTNQVKETNSTVDIGYHFVAVDGNGNVLDTDADGVADYLDEDSDGDGMPDSWEIQYFGNLNRNANDDADGDGVSNLVEYQQGLNPACADSDGDGLIDQTKAIRIAKPYGCSIMP
jgi:hypothetical protein